MTNDEVRRAQQLIADARVARRREDDTIAASAPSGVAGVARPFESGDRVLDLRSGKEGEISDVSPPDRTGAVLVGVLFDDGSRGLRDVADLMGRPKRPAARR
jgi:hypothetical protein